MNQELLKSLLEYNPATGGFTWLASRGSIKKGSVAGGVYSGGYRGIGINGKIYYSHRLAWLYIRGSFPELMIDHIDGDKLNNKWCNLREADRTQNGYNSAMKSNNTSGYKDVSFIKASGKWGSKIKVNGKNVWLGTFDSPKEASIAYNSVAKVLHGEYFNS